MAEVHGGAGVSNEGGTGGDRRRGWHAVYVQEWGVGRGCWVAIKVWQE